MTTFACKACGSVDLFIQENGSQTGLYCSDCGKWIKWVGKEEKRLAELQIERLKKIPMSEVKPLKESNIDLSEVNTEDLLSEIRRRIR